MPLVVGRLIEIVLTTPPGKRLADATGNPGLASAEGRRIVRKYSGAAAAVAFGAALALARPPAEQAAKPRGKMETVRHLSELLLAAGALLKVAVDFAHDRQEMERRRAHTA